MEFHPAALLGALVALTVLAWVASGLVKTTRRRRMAEIARQARLFYAPIDLLGLAPRVARLLPSPGAAQVRVSDLMYRSGGGLQQYVFTVEYTRGVMSHRRCVMQVASLTEPARNPATAPPLRLSFAADGIGRAEQYRLLAAALPDEPGRWKRNPQ